MPRAQGPAARESTLFGPADELAPVAATRGRRAAASQRSTDSPAAASGPACFAQVALNRPIDGDFTYRVPSPLLERVRVGVRVAVPFGKLREIGVVTAIAPSTHVAAVRLREIERVLDEHSPVGVEMLDLARWIGVRYACSFGEALHAMLPAALKREGGRRRTRMLALARAIAADELEALARGHEKQHRLLRTLIEVGGSIEAADLLRRLNLSEAPVKSLVEKGMARIEWREGGVDVLETAVADRPRPARLSDEQAAAVEALCAAVEARKPAAFLLEGVTGSGKTEVYLSVIERALSMGRGAIVLVPEIALTPQTVGWFRSRFGSVAVLHSRMGDVERARVWQRVARRELRVVVGARSAIFAPMPDLGVVVVDEEHEPSFKQGSVPRYHARDVAVEVARARGAVAILGSATPSLESWDAARAGRIGHLRLRSRVESRPLPPVEIVDLRNEGARGSRLFSKRLAHLLGEGLARKEQSILFQNRRGFAPVLWCPGCKRTLRCQSCDVALTWHQRISRLVCHVCCEERARPRACPQCSATGLRYLGAGSERIEDELVKQFPSARVLRMDSDTMRRREDYEEALARFARGEIDVLVGTQMIAKGLDFPRVSLVGVIDADVGLHLPDFRAAERTFQLIAQVAGRAGRGSVPGRIVVQTNAPEHPAIARAAHHDFSGFVAEEDALRRELGYPPHGRLVRVLVEDEDGSRAAASADAIAAGLTREFAPLGLAVLGPAPAPIALARGRHRHHLMLKAGLSEPWLDEALSRLRALAAAQTRSKVAIDVDPVSLL